MCDQCEDLELARVCEQCEDLELDRVCVCDQCEDLELTRVCTRVIEHIKHQTRMFSPR